MSRYIEFATASNFSFLRGASHPEELMVQAAHVGLAGLGLADRNSVAGVVRAHLLKREQNLALNYHPGARLVFCDGTPDILAYPENRPGWGWLCRLLTRGNLRAEKGDCILYLDDLLKHAQGLQLVVMEASSFTSPQGGEVGARRRRAPGEGGHTAPSLPPHPARSLKLASHPLPPGEREKEAHLRLTRLRDAAPRRVRLAAAMLYRGNDRARLATRAALARDLQLPLIAVNDVLYHHPDRRRLADVLTCIREHTTIDKSGRILAVNAERYLKPPAEMARLFCDQPQAIEETERLAATLTFSLDELRFEYPDESVAGFATAQEALTHLAYEGAARRYLAGIPDKVQQSLKHELDLIARLDYARYFLTVHNIVSYARSQNILCQGRGSAANSAVCFCLGITEVDPTINDLLFERFISSDRNEPPDIDVDFEHERREEVIQEIYRRYGRARAGIAATVICYRGRSAIREVGKAFGLSEDTIGALSSSIWGGGGSRMATEEFTHVGLAPDSPRVQQIRDLVNEIQSFPRHLSQHVGGFVMTRSRLDEVVPIMNGAMDERTHVEWDKDDLDALGILKVDVLGLGMLTCIRKAFELVEKHYGEALTLASVPKEDPAVYRMLQRADSLGVFQVESRAQMSMLPRLKPKEFYDLVIEVAIVRPGPIQGDMVHPYLRRRQRLEPVSYLSKDLEAVLRKTLGVPLFQEQAMRIAIVAGGFTPGEADKLRRAMATFKRTGTIGTFRDKMIAGMLAHGYTQDFAERCFSQIEGFGEYGFPESHAASFALLVYASSWLKCRYPDAFAAALLNAQPMGFYAPAQIVRDVREHGVEVRPVDVNCSEVEATLEPGPRAADRLHELHQGMRSDIRATHAIRLGLAQVKGLSEDDAKLIVERRCLPPPLAGEVARRSFSEGVQEGSISSISVPVSTSLPNPPPQGGREITPRYTSIRDLWLRTGLSPRVIERLADADAFGSLGLTRRQALWQAKALGRVGDRDDDLPLFRVTSLVRKDPAPSSPSLARELDLSSFTSPLEGEHRRPMAAVLNKEERRCEASATRRSFSEGGREGVISSISVPGSTPLPDPPPQGGRETRPASGGGSGEPAVQLPLMSLGEEVVNDYRFLELSLRAHPASFLRDELTARWIIRNEDLRAQKSGTRVTVSGLVTIRQRPGSAEGVVFMTIEDETGIANIIVWPSMFERFRPIVLGARYVAVTGKVQAESGVIHVVCERLDDLTPLLGRLAQGPPVESLARCDEVKRPVNELRALHTQRSRNAPLPPPVDVSELASDLDVPAHGSAHTPSRRGGSR